MGGRMTMNRKTAPPLDRPFVPRYTRENVDGVIHTLVKHGLVASTIPCVQFGEALMDAEMNGVTPERVAEARRIGYAYIDAQDARLRAEGRIV